MRRHVHKSKADDQGINVLTNYTMLTLGIILFHLFPGPQHMITGLYYLIRAYFTEDLKPKVDFADLENPHVKYSDLWCVPLSTLFLTVPKPSTGDYVFVPWVVLHVMGYGSPVWYTVLAGAFFTVYAFLRHQVLYTCIGAIASGYIRGDNMRLGLVFAAGCHLILSAIEPLKFSFFSACVVLFMAEAKLRMRFQWELIPPVYPSVNLFAAPVYCFNFFLYGWEDKWKYTSKNWRSFDIAFVIFNISTAILATQIYGINE